MLKLVAHYYIHCSHLQKIFPEAAAAASGKKMDDGSGSSSDDSEDEEYDPDKPDSSEKVEEDKSSSDESSYLSASNELVASHNNERYLGLPSDDSEDDDFDPSAPDQDNQVKQGSSSSDFTSDSEDLGGLIEDETVPSEDQTSPSTHHKQEPLSFNEEIPNVGRKKRQSVKDELSYLLEASAEPLSGKRRVERLDYQKLNDVSLLFSHFHVLHDTGTSLDVYNLQWIIALKYIQGCLNLDPFSLELWVFMAWFLTTPFVITW